MERNRSGFAQYNADGTVSLEGTREDFADPRFIDLYWFEDAYYYTEIIQPADYKCAGIIGVYEARFLENGNLVFTVINDDCEERIDGYVGQREPLPIDI